MLCKVLQPFPYAHDGCHTVGLKAGQVVAIDESVLAGLVEGGWVDRAEPADIEAAQEGPVVITPPLEIPDDWRALRWTKRRALAAKLNGGAAPANDRVAVALIEAELARRAELAHA